MKSIRVLDVGDGLCVQIETDAKNHVLLDCGSRQEFIARRLSYEWQRIVKANTFILSHFHHDHYSGLLNPDSDELWGTPLVREFFHLLAKLVRAAAEVAGKSRPDRHRFLATPPRSKFKTFSIPCAVPWRFYKRRISSL
jgi:metal-dependent hydrolase (beta-lactamase superfamily II)